MEQATIANSESNPLAVLTFEAFMTNSTLIFSTRLY